MTETATEARPRKLVPISQSISVLPTDTARIYNYIHPVLILSLYYLCFPSLVADPVSTLKKSIAPLAHLQIIYCVVCLPPSKGSSTQPTPSTTPKKKKVQFARPAAKVPATLASRIVPALFSFLLSLSLSAPLLTVVLILFGAPLTTHFWHNLLCATHISLLGVLPLFYVHGVDGRMWREISGACLPFDEVWGGVVGSVVGAWLGAIPIPLDWDREWQKWPVTIVTGTYLGWFVFRFAGEYLLKGKRIEFD
ncbi:hypothetical protein N7G274_009911 [Stereocaulon virgatum]|uniref:Glycosylphosphatidylinositol anchor biosynthesis protein 11 n=1 Tax=Stereocaulon virgatum TaxID=373712 RepID=A0ABR3ZXI3_9LECA